MVRLRPIYTQDIFKLIFAWANKYSNFIGHTKGKYFQIRAPSPVVPNKIAAKVIKTPARIDPVCPNFKFRAW